MQNSRPGLESDQPGSRRVPEAQGGAGSALPTHPASTISVCIVCRNEAERLGPCLESAAWADEILVMDLLSTDGSATVARRHGAQVIKRTPYPIVEPLRNELAEEARGEWILVLDPDERVSPGLAVELRQLAASIELDAVIIPRMNRDLGFAPSNPLHRFEPQLRMYRRSAVVWPVTIHALPKVPKHRLHRLPEHDDLVIVHDRNRNIPEVLDRVMRYAPEQAQSMLDEGQVFSAKKMLVALIQASYKQFLVGRAWKDGVPGMLRASILVGNKFYVWVAFWQLSGARRTAEDDRLIRRIGVMLEATRKFVRLCQVIHKPINRLFSR